METYSLEKWIWTEADFDSMGWHDATIYAMKLDGDLSFDIDYIFKWNQPEVENFYFTFYVAPCTLTFKSIHRLTFELSQCLYNNATQIDDIECEVINGEAYYTILTQEGYLSFSAAGYIQTVRMQPSFQLSQAIPYDERDGTSFEATTDGKLSPDVQERVRERKAKQFEQYTWAKERHLINSQIDALQQKRDSNQIPLNEFFIQMKSLQDKLAYYNIILPGTKYNPGQPSPCNSFFSSFPLKGS